MKTCSKCKIEKEFSEFHKSKSEKSGYYSCCKSCKKAYRDRPEVKERASAWNKEHHAKPEVKERRKIYLEKYYLVPSNKERKSIKQKEYESRPNTKKKNQVRHIEKMESDITYKLNHLLRDRFNKAIKNNSKSGSAVSDLGCSIKFLKNYLESKFQDDMSWENHGIHGWHIDHIIPLSSFDLTDREQFLKAVHYTNLQPLWALDNLSKSDKILPKP